jgi:RNA polymerase sigma factor (sigma-70 family)
MSFQDMSMHFRLLVDECNRTLRWGLGTDRLQRYTAALARYADPADDEATVRRILINYHLDHQQVESLLDTKHQLHDRDWQSWSNQAVVVLRSAGLAWSSDTALDTDDLAQIARSELARALPTFRYQSRFSSWAYRVILQAVQRYIRDSQAMKRKGQPASLDQLNEESHPHVPADNPQEVAQAADLHRLVQDVLTTHSDKRLSYLFKLWAIEDRRVVEIGSIVGLHPSRVRALLQLCRTVLRNDPAIRSWIEQQ